MAKYLDKTGLQTLWAKVKEQDSKVIKENVTDKLGVASGIATLGSDSKLTASQLPALKTINNESIVGSGNISIDLNVYQLVEGSLPEAATANPNKIYLLLSGTAGAQDKYTEYAVVNGEWEKFGEYKAEVDLTPYVKKDALLEEGKAKGFVTFDDVATDEKNGVLDKKYYNLLKYAYEGVDYKSRSDYKSCILNHVIPRQSLTSFALEYNFIERFISSSGSESISQRTWSRNLEAANGGQYGVMSPSQAKKLEAIADEATKDEAITSEELDEILV